MSILFVDVETAPLKDQALAQFDPKSVKLGNIKDEEKRAAKIEEAKAAAVAKAALNPFTAQLITIQYAGAKGEVEILSGKEAEMLAEFWQIVQDREAAKIVTWDAAGHWKRNFDAQMVRVRSWINGVRPNVAKPWESAATPLAEYADPGTFYALEKTARQFGIEVKDTAPVTGKNFHEFWLAKDPMAVEYAKQDVELLRSLYFKLKGMAE